MMGPRPVRPVERVHILDSGDGLLAPERRDNRDSRKSTGVVQAAVDGTLTLAGTPVLTF